MADLTSSIKIILSGAPDASAGLRDVGDSMGSLGERATGIVEAMAGATAGVLKFEAGIISTGAAVVGFSIGAADKFDASFREIATLTDQTVDGLSDFRQSILDYASGSTQSLENITGAVYNAISAGVSYKDSLSLINTTEKLSVAGKADLNQTTLAVVSTLNAYGESTDKAAKYSDALFQVVKLGQTTLPELASGLSGVTSTAVLAGQPIEQVGAAIATLTAAGAPTSEALTRLNALLSAIIKPTGEAATLAKELGLEWDIQALKSKGLSGVLAEMADKTGGAGDKIAILTGGTEALNAANVLAISSSGKFKDNLEAMRNATGSVDAAFAKMKDATDTLAQAFTVALINLGTPLLENFGAIGDALAELATSFGTVVKSDAFAPLISVVETNLGKIAELIRNVAKNLPEAFAGVDFKPFAQSLQGLFDSVSNLFNFKALSTKEGLTASIQTVTNLLTQTTVYSSGAVESLGPFVKKVGELVAAISTIDINKIETIGRIGGYALAATTAMGTLGAATLAFAGLSSAIPGVGAAMSAVKAEAASLSLGLAGSGTGSLVAALGKAGVAGAVGYLSYQIASSTGLGEWLNDVLAPDWLLGKGATTGTAIADLADAISSFSFEGIINKFNSMIERIDTMGATALGLPSIFDNVFGGIKVAVNAVQVTFDFVVLGLLSIKQKLLEAGLAAAEFSQNFTFTDANKAQNLVVIKGYKDSLNSLGETMDAVSANIDRNKKELEDGWKQATDSASIGTGDLSRGVDNAAKSIAEHRAEIIKNYSAMQDWSNGLQQGAALAENTAKSISFASDKMMDWSDGFRQNSTYIAWYVDDLTKLKDGMIEVANPPEMQLPEGVNKAIDVYKEAGTQTGIYKTALDGLSTSYTQTISGTVKATGAFASVSDAAAKQAAAIDEATKKSQTYQLKMEEIASNERIKIIESKIKLNIAELEAQTKQVEAAFKSIDTTIESTGQLLGSLFGDLSKADTYTKLAIEDQIKLENERRQKALDLQTKLAEAEIEKIQAQKDALNRGDGTIKINAEGMEPEIKAFMYKILKLIRIETSRDVSNYLLGLNPT